MSATPVVSGRTYTCHWCGTISDGAALTCPACGSTINVSEIVTPTGWIELPGRKDMAKLQIGKSSCQIEGMYVPVADFNLAQGDSVYFAHHVLLWKEMSVNIGMMSMKGAWKRAFAGMPIFMTQAVGPGHIAFSRDLRHWTAHPDPLYKAGGNPSGLDKNYAHKISLVWNPQNETFYLYYCACGNKGRGIGLITGKPAKR